MTNMNHNIPDEKLLFFECIDQELGSELWKLEVEDTSPELRHRLETHLTFCADCRMKKRLSMETARGLSEGKLKLPRRSNVVGLSRSMTASGLLALAASVLLVFLLPPVAPHEKMAVRGADEGQAILRPVPDEILHDTNPLIVWQELPEATSFTVRIEGVDNGYRWEQKSSDTKIQIPAGMELPVSERFRVFVEPVPAYLAPAGGWRSSFSTAPLVPFVKYRLGAAPALARGLGLASLGLLLLGAVVPLLRKRTLSAS